MESGSGLLPRYLSPQRLLLTNDSREDFFRVKGRGHFLGRQFSIASDEARFKGFNTVMEGNNEVAVDGRAKAFEYLGGEDPLLLVGGLVVCGLGHTPASPT